MRHGTGRWVVLLAVLFVVVVLMPISAAQQAPPLDERGRDTTLTEGRSATPSGEQIADIWLKVIWVSAAIFLLVMVVLVYALVRWRHRRGEKRDVPQIHGNSKMEIAWTIGPALIMIWLLVISYNGLFQIDEPGVEPEVYVDVSGHAFFWEYEYSDGSSSSGGDSVLRLATGTWVQLNVTGADVHHAYKVPGLDVMIDAMPGRVNKIMFYTGDEPGVYLAQCMRFCGSGHGEMQSTVEIFDAGEQSQPFGVPSDGEEANETQKPENGNATEEPDDNATRDDVDRTIEITLQDMFFDPGPLELEPGETVALVVRNEDPMSHDLNLGEYSFEENRGEAFCPEDGEDCWNTPLLGSDEEHTLVITAPDEPVALDMWCSVPGHVQQGMISFMSVGGAEPAENGGNEPRLPGPGLALLLVALGGIVAVLRRNRG